MLKILIEFDREENCGEVQSWAKAGFMLKVVYEKRR